MKVELKHFEGCFMPGLIYRIKKRNKKNRENPMKDFKRDIYHTITQSASYTGILREAGTCLAEERIEFAAITLYQNKENSDEDRNIKKMIEEKKVKKGMIEEIVEEKKC